MAKRAHTTTPLAQFISDKLHELGLKQVDFCRQTGFDQGLLSKLQTSVITTINLESALKLAEAFEEFAVVAAAGDDDAAVFAALFFWPAFWPKILPSTPPDFFCVASLSAADVLVTPCAEAATWMPQTSAKVSARAPIVFVFFIASEILR